MASGITPRHAVWLFFSLLFVFFGFAIPCFSETRYVSDVMVVTLREGPGDGHAVITALRSDTPLEVVEETDEWVKVRTGDNKMGYMKKRYTTTETPDPVIIERLETEIERLKSVRQSAEAPDGELEKEIADLSEKSEALEEKVAESEAEIARLGETLGRVTAERDSLKSRLENTASSAKEFGQLTETIRRLRAANAELEPNGLINRLFSEGKGWVLVGGFVFLSGWITARLSRSQRRKKYF